MNELSQFLLNFVFNFGVALLIVRCVYYPATRHKGYVFTFLAFNTMIYFVLSLLTHVEIGLGVGFGLFAIFTILRYRTDPIPIREMTYLFVLVALPVVNALNVAGDLWPQLIAANLTVLALVFVLEREWGFRYEATQHLVYEKIELIRPDRRPELLADLEQRTGLKVKGVRIEKIDFLRDVASLTIRYDDHVQDAWLRPAMPASGKDDDD